MPPAKKAAVGDAFYFIQPENAEKKGTSLRKAGYTVTVEWQKHLVMEPSAVADWQGRPEDADSVQGWSNLHVVTVLAEPEPESRPGS